MANSSCQAHLISIERVHHATRSRCARAAYARAALGAAHVREASDRALECAGGAPTRYMQIGRTVSRKLPRCRPSHSAHRMLRAPPACGCAVPQASGRLSLWELECGSLPVNGDGDWVPTAARSYINVQIVKRKRVLALAFLHHRALDRRACARARARRARVYEYRVRFVRVRTELLTTRVLVSRPLREREDGTLDCHCRGAQVREAGGENETGNPGGLPNKCKSRDYRHAHRTQRQQ